MATTVESSITAITSCLEASECRESLSVTVVGGVELDDARLDDSSAEETKLLLLSTNSANEAMARRCAVLFVSLDIYSVMCTCIHTPIVDRMI
jgi:hypothetical protein